MVSRNDQWEKVELLIPEKANDCGVTGKENHLFLEAVLWVCRTGPVARPSGKSWELAYGIYSL